MSKVAPGHSFGIRMGQRLGRAETRRDYDAFWHEMMPCVADTVIRSFMGANGGMRSPSMSEVKERTEFCKKLVDELRKDLGWGKARIRDHLPVVLRARLAGIEIPLEKLSRRATW